MNGWGHRARDFPSLLVLLLLPLVLLLLLLILLFFLASLRTRHEMSRTSKSASRCPVNDEQPSNGEQELDDQLTQEQFDNEIEKDLEVMLTQE